MKNHIKKNNDVEKIILIGCGPHSKRVYLPAIKEIKNFEIALVIDLESNKYFVNNTLIEYNYDEVIFTEAFFDHIPNDLVLKLNHCVSENNIKGVIIATEPLVHKLYAQWALSLGLNILMDKPITTNVDVVSSLNNAQNILNDYNDLLNDYRNLQQSKETIFVINAQRRFHSGFNLVIEKIKEVTNLTNCPVTFIQAYHCDGQWRLPNEIVTQQYHPYCCGYGKASHSGYHIFDIVAQMLKAGYDSEKYPDKMQIMSSFIQPNGFIKQLNENDYKKYFGDEYDDVKLLSDSNLSVMYENYGEIDISSIISFSKGNDVITNVNINLLHNGFAGRTWLKPGEDLYKGNGRIKHEQYNLQQGPFQNIQIHSYQAYDKHDVDNGLEDQLGGKNHFDIYIFRNPKIATCTQQPEIIKLSELNSINDNRLFMENVKYKVVREFYEYLVGIRVKEDVKSQIEDHQLGVQIMSGIYCSHINKNTNSNSLFEQDVFSKQKEYENNFSA